MKGSSSYDVWWSPVAMIQYALSKQWKLAARAEYYQDKTGIIIAKSPLSSGFQTSGYSLNIDYQPTKEIICRVETRFLQSQENLFEQDGMPSNDNFILAASMAMKFSYLKKYRP